VSTSEKGWEPLAIASERDFRQRMRDICRRLNEAPEVARLLLINPVLVLEDVGVTLTPAMREHVMQSLRFPKRRAERLAVLERQLREEGEALGVTLELPLDGERRARLVREVLAREAAPGEGRPGEGRPSEGEGPPGKGGPRRTLAPEALTRGRASPWQVPTAADVPASLGVRELRAFRQAHPFLRTLAACERTRQGALAFFPRDVYERFKSGELQHRWVRSIRFNV